MPTSGLTCNICFAEPAAELVFEVISLCNRIGAVVQRKESIATIGIEAV
jgi:hypothetical protein